MAKIPKEPEKEQPMPSEDEILRRMLNTPPKPHKKEPAPEKTEGD